MQTAAATAPRSAREAVAADGLITNATGIDEHATRFFVQMGWDALSVDTSAIPNRYLLRGEITPCQSFRQSDMKAVIPEGMIIKGSERKDGDGREVYASYWKTAYAESERLLGLEGMKDWKEGVFEITALSEQPRLYQQIDFNKLFYSGATVSEAPMSLANLPERNTELLAHLKQRVEYLKTNPPADIPGFAMPAVLEVGNALIRATEAVSAMQRDRLAYTHRCLELPPKDEGGFHKRGYDSVDEEMLKRTGIPRISEEKIKTAIAIESLAKGQDKQNNSGNDALLAMVEMQREQNVMLRAQMEEQREQSRQQALLIQQLMSGQRVATDEVQSNDDAPKPKRKLVGASIDRDAATS